MIRQRNGQPPAPVPARAITADVLRAWLRLACRTGEITRPLVDSLNVFPVPDSDTGTNVLLTVRAACDALDLLPSGTDLAQASRAAADGAVRGARGNSGLLISQALTALADVCAEAPEPDGLRPVELVHVYERIAATTWAAVSHPVPGTLLTVARDAAAASRTALEESGPAAPSSVSAICAAAAFGAQESVVETAGLGHGPVDAGGAALARTAVSDLVDVVERMTSDSVAQHRDVAWVERPRMGTEPPRLTLAPIDVAGPVADALFDERVAVLTSATLALGGGFEPMARDLGLTLAEAPWEGVDVGTPFDYARQGILYTPVHLPRPGRGISEAALDEVLALTEASRGGMLGLFSSRRAAEEAAGVLRGATDLTVYAQGEDQLPALVEAFAADEDSCLVGTLSLWQGVDVPGRTCRLVIIDRIPFPRPDDPVAQARSEAVATAGGNGFMSVAATHAALLLAQGAGRLIRRAEDRGVVAVLDPRLRTARYGAFLARSMPPLWPTRDRDVVLGALGRLAAM